MSGAQPMTQRSQEKVRFDHRDMDFYFSWILGRQHVSGSDAGECFAAAERIADGDPASWQDAWPNLARRVEDEAARALQVGDLARARGLPACLHLLPRAPVHDGPRQPPFP